MKRTFYRIPQLGLILACVLAPLGAKADGLAGSYLAATHASIQGDFEAAARYYTKALVRDPGNPGLLQNALMANVGKGSISQAVPIARRLDAIQNSNQLSGLVLLADAIRSGEYETAKEILSQDERAFNPLMRALLQGWVEVGRGDITEARKLFDGMQQNEAFQVFGQYHKALALAFVGDLETADTLLKGDEKGPLQINRSSVLAHAQVLVQLDKRDEAVALLDEATAGRFRDVGISQLREDIVSGKEMTFTHIERPEDGAAEVFFTLAGALNREDAGRFALVYARLAHYVRPDLVEALLVIAETLEAQGQYDLSIKAYEAVPKTSPMFLSSEIGRADALLASDQAAAGIEVLKALARDNPDASQIFLSLGDAYRSEELYAEGAEAYTSAIELIGEPSINHWILFYSRGICYEREKKWDLAEADFRKALELQPDQPLVLNYLGYSLVEFRLNLDEALEMIKKAVAGRPQDGYITDSLGWVYYRLGRFEEAVDPMERAVRLQPVDPIINDHLGDVYWMVDRKREAEFQWRRALSFEPEEKDAERIRLKLDIGLDAVLEQEEAADPEATSSNGG